MQQECSALPYNTWSAEFLEDEDGNVRFIIKEYDIEHYLDLHVLMISGCFTLLSLYITECQNQYSTFQHTREYINAS